MPLPSYDFSSQRSTYLADWIGLPNGQSRFCHRWIPCIAKRKVEHVCVLIHGLGDHGGRYAALGEYLSDHGIALQVVDLIGHGKSPGKRGRIESYTALMDEISTTVHAAQQVWQHAQICLIGQSMGGNLAVGFALGQTVSEPEEGQLIPIIRPRVHRFVLIAPMLVPEGKPIREDFLAVGRRLSQWLPDWPMRLKSRVDWLTDDPSAQRAYREDALLHRTMSIRLGIELLVAGRESLERASQLDLPTLLIHGDRDRLASIKASAQFASQSPGASLVTLPEGLHDPLSCQNRRSVMELIRRFVTEDTGQRVHFAETMRSAA